MKDRVRAAVETHQVIDRDDRVRPLRIDLQLFSVLIDKFAADEFRSIPFIPLEVNTRAGLRVARGDLDQFCELSASDFNRNQRVFKWQQLEDVAGAQFT